MNFQTQESLRLLSLSPLPGAEDADLSPVEILWEAFDETYNFFDLDEFEVERDGDLYPVTIELLGAGLVRVTCDVGIFPDESITLTARAKTIDGVGESVTWSFRARLSMDVTSLSQVAPDLGSQTDGNATAHLMVSYYGSDITSQGRVGLFVRVPIQTENGLADFLVYEFSGSYDEALGRLTPAVSFQDVGILSSLETGDPVETPVMWSLVAGPGQPGVIGPYLSEEVRGLIQWQGEPLSLQLGYRDGSLYIFPLSLETGKPVVTAGLYSVEIQQGEGLKIFLDILSAKLSKLRE